MSARAQGNRRGAELAAIHMGKKALGWDDETYRDCLFQLTGKSSAADLSALQRAVVLDRMRDLGFGRATGKPSPPPRPRLDPATQIDKVRALWGSLADLGELRDPSEAAMQAFGERQTGKSRLDWCTPAELNAVIEGLKAWSRRARAKARGKGA